VIDTDYKLPSARRSDGFMGSQQLIDVVFKNQFGMYLGPVVGCADKG